MRILLGAPVLIFVAMMAITAVGEPPERASPDESWNLVFSRLKGWTGGDVAGSVDLQDGRTLWVFGDTWFGEVRKGKHAAGSKIVNNSIAVHNHKAGGVPPTPDAIQFFGGKKDASGNPTAWVKPTKRVASDDAHRTWCWANGGSAVIPESDGKGGRLVVFLFHIGRRAGDNGIWNFKSVGGAMALVDNLNDSPDRWQPRVVRIPHVVNADTAQTRSKLRETSWGVAACLDTDSQYLYLYGVRETTKLNKQLILARVAARSVEKFDQWRFYAGDGRWSDRLVDCAAVANNVVSELSVSRYVDERGKTTLIMVHSEPVFGPRILVRTASRHEGPWSKPRPVYTVPEIGGNKKYFTYAAKGHLHLSRPGELLVTYIVNSHDFGAMVNDASIYRPKFVRVPLPMILGDR